MKHKNIRILTGILTGFVALTAIGGGIAMLAEVDRFPLEWLKDTPFNDYTLPALVLAIAVGGSSLIAAFTLFMNRESSVPASLVAGLLLAGFIVVEVITLKQTPAGPTLIECLYFATGLVIFGLAAYLLWEDNRAGHKNSGGLVKI